MNYDEKYDLMHNEFMKVNDKWELLRYQLFGYNISLDHVVNYSEEIFPGERCSKAGIGIDSFVDKICEYYSGFTETTGKCFKEPCTEEDLHNVKNLIICLIAFLKNECNRADYTFMGIVKLLKTFLIDVDEEYNNDINCCVFGILYSDIKEKIEKEYDEKTRNCFNEIFEQFDFNYVSRLADGIYYCIKYYLYDNKMDYVSDPIMMKISEEMMDEISDRLKIIKNNRSPREKRRYRR